MKKRNLLSLPHFMPIWEEGGTLSCKAQKHFFFISFSLFPLKIKLSIFMYAQNMNINTKYTSFVTNKKILNCNK